MLRAEIVKKLPGMTIDVKLPSPRVSWCFSAHPRSGEDDNP